MNTNTLPPLPHSWSELTWEQLTQMWEAKIRYGGQPDMARAAALLSLCGCYVCRDAIASSPRTGETVYTLKGKDGKLWATTARELSYLAKQALPWFDYPYGDQGENEERDNDGNVTRERREPVIGYVSPMRDAMILPQDKVKIKVSKTGFAHWFKLPDAACNNLTWQQYRTIQNITPQLFSENATDEQTIDLQAQFLAHILTPRSIAVFDKSGDSIKFRQHYTYEYNTDRAEGMVPCWKKVLTRNGNIEGAVLFYICFQVYQTALEYYSISYPLLFSGNGKHDQLKDALTGEVNTINAVMMEANYTNQQEVYDSNVTFILDILNTMAKKAKEIERMNAKIKKK